MMDSSFSLLIPYLQQPSIPTLWLADENALNTLQALTALPIEEPKHSSSNRLHIVTNRYDIYQLAQQKNISAEFNDFTLSSLPFIPERIIYRISKEKPLTHYLFNQSAQLLNHSGELIVSGKKQEGIKGYADNLSKIIGCQGKLKKTKNDYFGIFSQFENNAWLDDQQYAQLQQPFAQAPKLYSKPGVFGWNKIDQGTELLLSTLPAILDNHPHTIHNILDLGCGYGWIFTNVEKYFPIEKHAVHITATDNNATAIVCAHENTKQSSHDIIVVADDCASQIQTLYDLILCNPPFHQGFSHDKSLTRKFLTQTKRLLSPTGIAVFVVNDFVKFPIELLNQFTDHHVVTTKQGFTIVALH